MSGGSDIFSLGSQTESAQASTPCPQTVAGGAIIPLRTPPALFDTEAEMAADLPAFATVFNPVHAVEVAGD